MPLTEDEEFEMLSLERQRSSINPISNSQNPSFLPRYSNVMESQSQREDPLSIFKKEQRANSNILQNPLHFPLLALKGINIPLSRAESGVASAGLELQAGRSPLDAIAGFSKGISGQKQAQLGDLIRTTGFGGKLNESIASTVGLIGQAGMISLPTKIDYVKALNNANKFISNKVPKIMNRKWVNGQLGNLDNVLKDTMKANNSAISEAYQPIYSNSVNQKRLNDIVSKLKGLAAEESDEVLNKINSIDIKPNIKTVKEIKDIVSDSIPSGAWRRLKVTGEEVGLGNKRKIDAYNSLKKLITESIDDPSDKFTLELANKKYEQAADLVGALRKKISGPTKGSYNSSYYKQFDDNTNRDLLDELNKINSNTRDFIKNVDKFKARQTFKKAASIGGGFALAGGGAGYIASKLKE